MTESLSPPARGTFLKSLPVAGAFHLRSLHRFRAWTEGALDHSLVLAALWLNHLAHQAPSPEQVTARAELASLCKGRSSSPRDSLRGLATLTGMPRETLRRHLHSLARAGWVNTDGDRWQLDLTRLAAVWESEDWQLGVGDLVWCAERIEEMSQPGLDRASFPLALASAQTTRAEDLPLNLRREILNASAAASRPDACARLLGHSLRHMMRLRAAFQGDLDLVLLLGEIAHTNMRVIRADMIDDLEQLVAAAQAWRADPAKHVSNHSANAHSLALCLQLPVETARRKLARLRAMGWVMRNRKYRYVTHPRLFAETELMLRAANQDLLETARALKS